MTGPEQDDASARPEHDVADELVSHKATRECPMIEPHRRGICGIVSTRERVRHEADARRRGSPPA
jgi:hypothetical protein